MLNSVYGSLYASMRLCTLCLHLVWASTHSCRPLNPTSMDFVVSVKDSRVVETNSLVLVAAGIDMVVVESKNEPADSLLKKLKFRRQIRKFGEYSLCRLPWAIASMATWLRISGESAMRHALSHPCILRHVCYTIALKPSRGAITHSLLQ
jgi:hypothetical protein